MYYNSFKENQLNINNLYCNNFYNYHLKKQYKNIYLKFKSII